jgi:uncharacterized metal-binding protein YceD (DUF177 family)
VAKQRSFARPPWTVAMPVADLPETGRRIDLAADESTRTAIAVAAGVRSIDRLEAMFELTRDGRDGVRVTGRVSAEVGQLCVVTLEPLQAEVDEAFDLVFRPPAEAPKKRSGRAAAEEATGSGASAASAASDASDEPPEVMRGGVIDLGAVATEFLILAIDPYPRKPGVAFEPPPVEADPAAHPFAALAALKKN